MKIGVCFPALDFETMEFDHFLSYIIELKKEGVNSFDFYTTFFLEMSYEKEKLINIFNDNNIKITMHYQGNMRNAASVLKKINQNIDLNYNIPIVFHLPSYDDSKYEHVRNVLDMIAELLTFSKFDILIETLSKNHPNTANLGDDISEINLFLRRILHPNFGICWDLGHTRLNNIETGSSLYINDISRVKMTHIHNFYYKNKFIDHIPLGDLDYQDEEIRYLVENGYKGIFSLEFPLNNLKENIYVYIDSIKKLKKLIMEVEYEFRKTS